MDPKKFRTSCSLTVQYIWDALLFIRNQKQVANFGRIANYLKRFHSINEGEVKMQLKYAVRDGLLRVDSKVGVKGSRIGLRQDVYRLPVTSVEKPSHDWYCFECHIGGSVLCCNSCHRVFHPRCISSKKKNPRSFTCRICQILAVNSSFKIRREDLNILLSYTCKRLKVSEEEGKPCLATFNLRWVPGEKAVTPSETQAFPYQPLQEIGVQNLVFDNKDDWRHAYLIYQYLDLVMMQEKACTRKYRLLEEFQADAENVVHNVFIFHGVHSPIANVAKQMLQDCIYDLTEIRQCRDCYRMSNQTSNRFWFCKPCDPPHALVYAKQTGFPYWPAKVIKVADGVYDVRFFGGLHQRANIDRKCIKSINYNVNGLSVKRTTAWDRAFEELKHHQKLLKTLKREKRSASTVIDAKDTESELSDGEPKTKKPKMELNKKSIEARSANSAKNHSVDKSGKTAEAVKVVKNLCDVRLQKKVADLSIDNAFQKPMETSSEHLSLEKNLDETMSKSNSQVGSLEFDEEIGEPRITRSVSRIGKMIKEKQPKNPLQSSIVENEVEAMNLRPASRLGKRIKDTQHLKSSVQSTIYGNEEEARKLRPASILGESIKDAQLLKSSVQSTIVGNEEEARDLRPALRLGKRIDTQSVKNSLQSTIYGNEEEARDLRPASRLGKRIKDVQHMKNSVQSTIVGNEDEARDLRPASRLGKMIKDAQYLKTSVQCAIVENEEVVSSMRPASRLGKMIKDVQHMKNSVQPAIVGNEEEARDLRPASRLGKRIKDAQYLKSSVQCTIVGNEEEANSMRPVSRLGKRIKDAQLLKTSVQSAINGNEEEASSMRPASRLGKRIKDVQLPRTSVQSTINGNEEEASYLRPSSRLGKRIKDAQLPKTSVQPTIHGNEEEASYLRPSSRLGKRIKDAQQLKSSMQSAIVGNEEKAKDDRLTTKLERKIKEVPGLKTPKQSSIMVNEQEVKHKRPIPRSEKKCEDSVIPKPDIQSTTDNCDHVPKTTRLGPQLEMADETVSKTIIPSSIAESDVETALKIEASITSSTKVSADKLKQMASVEDFNVVSSSSSETPILKCSVSVQTRFLMSKRVTKSVQTEQDSDQTARSLALAHAKAELELKINAEEELKQAKEKMTKDLTQKLEKKYADDKEKSVTATVARVKAEMQLMHQEIEDRLTTNHAEEIRTINQRHQHMISEVKKKQWCYNCEAEAIYHCCWNTSYCSIECQQIHWQKEHKRSCRRKR